MADSGRAARLKHARIVKLLYCYVNLRLLHNVDTDVLNMVEDALEQALDEADAIASGATIECDDATSSDVVDLVEAEE